jgi:hypothetical protein
MLRHLPGRFVCCLVPFNVTVRGHVFSGCVAVVY